MEAVEIEHFIVVNCGVMDTEYSDMYETNIIAVYDIKTKKMEFMFFSYTEFILIGITMSTTCGDDDFPEPILLPDELKTMIKLMVTIPDA